jgi:hypothetical protein
MLMLNNLALQESKKDYSATGTVEIFGLFSSTLLYCALYSIVIQFYIMYKRKSTVTNLLPSVLRQLYTLSMSLAHPFLFTT